MLPALHKLSISIDTITNKRQGGNSGEGQSSPRKEARTEASSSSKGEGNQEDENDVYMFEPVTVNIVESEDDESEDEESAIMEDWKTDVESKLMDVNRAMPSPDLMQIYKRDGWPPEKAVAVMQTAMVRLWIAILDTPLAALLMVDNANGRWARNEMKLVWDRMKKIIKQNPGGYPMTDAGIKSKKRSMDTRLRDIKTTMEMIELEILLTSGTMELNLGEVLEYLDTIEISLKRELDTRSGEEYDNVKGDPPPEIQQLRRIPFRSAEEAKALNEWKQDDLQSKQAYVVTAQVDSPSLEAVRYYRAQVQAMMQQEEAKKEQALQQRERERLFKKEAQKREMQRLRAAGHTGKMYASSSSDDGANTTDDEAPTTVTSQRNSTNGTGQQQGETGDESTEEGEEGHAAEENTGRKQEPGVAESGEYDGDGEGDAYIRRKNNERDQRQKDYWDRKTLHLNPTQQEDIYEESD